MNISRLGLENFKNFKFLQADFHPGVNLFVGVNGSGKTSLLEALCVAARGFFGSQGEFIPRIIEYKEIKITNGKRESLSQVGAVFPKHNLPQNVFHQVEAFINILNIGNHSFIQGNRRNLLDKIIQPIYTMPKPEKRRYLQFQFERIYNDPTIEYRQYLLICLANRLGVN